MADQYAIGLVLVAAVLHATWNALVKGAADKTITLALIAFMHVLVGMVLVWQFPPPSVDSWWFIIASTIIHFGYYAFLLRSYRLGDLSQVYPIARGSAPIIVALGATFFANEILGLLGWIAILLVSFGIGLLVWTKNSLPQKPAIISAIMTGIMIALYSLVDGLGIRASNSPGGYIGWLFLLEITVVLAIGVMQLSRLHQISRKTLIYGTCGGLISACAYGMVLYAKTLIPLAMVSALRESSVIIAALIGVIIFGERPWRLRLVAAIIVICGIVLLGVTSKN